MPEVRKLLERNARWADDKRASDPDFFLRLSGQQKPRYLWIGCADSRVPANDIVGLDPGEIFVHRNVGNVVVHTDLNCLSVLQYAIDVLRIRHVIVCGHYGCGGVAGALHPEPLGLIDNWLRHVEDVATKHGAELDEIDDDEARVNRLCELNVIEQVAHVCRTTIVQDAWARRQSVSVNGWIYGLADGHVRDLGMRIDGPEHVVARRLAAVESSRAGRGPTATIGTT